MELTGTNQIPQAVNVFYNRTLLENARPHIPHMMYGQSKPLPKNSGLVMKFRRYGTLANNTTPLTEGVTPIGKKMSYTDITTTVEQYGDFVTITDKVQMTTLDPLLTETAMELGEQAGQSLDVIIRDIIVAGTNIQYANGRTARDQIVAGDVLDAGEIKIAVRTLKRLNAKRITKIVRPDAGTNTTPVDAAFIGIVHPDTTFDLMSDSNFVTIEKYASKANVMPYEVGKLHEARFIETTQAKVFEGEGSGGADVYATLILAANAYGVSQISGAALENIVKPLGSAGTADPLNQRSTSGWKATLAAIILNQDYMVRVEHGATA